LSSADLAAFPAVLSAIDADSSTNVWAVGYQGDGSTNSVPIAEHWKGETWALTSPRTVPGSTSTQLFGVSVLGRRNVWAVGSATVDGVGMTSLAEHWNGKRWTIVSTPNPAGSDVTGFSAISGDQADDLWAVGLAYDPSTFGYTAFAEHWNGKKWALSDPVDPSGSWSPLRGVASTPGSGALTVGEYEAAAGEYDALAEVWDDHAWSQTALPTPRRAVVSSLYAVSAADANHAYAAGCWSTTVLFCGIAGGEQQPLVERWQGTTWKLVKVPLPADATDGGFTAVSLDGPSEGWAVGEATVAGSGVPYLAHLTNGHWRAQASPELQGDSYFGGVTALAPDDAWAVGATSAGPLAEHWNGTKWRVVATPKP
jgi:hypothetical protein